MTDIGATTRLRPAPSIYARPFGEELVLLEFGKGEYFALDEIGARIWRGLESCQELAAIAADVASAYDVSAEEALADIVALVDDMRARSLVEVT